MERAISNLSSPVFLLEACQFLPFHQAEAGCRTSQHVECVRYLLEKGADPCAETDSGDNCLHMAAKNGYTECMNEILQAHVSIGTSEPARLADVILPYSVPVKYVDLRNSKNLAHFLTPYSIKSVAAFCFDAAGLLKI